MRYTAQKCPCGKCNDWYVDPVAAVHGVNFTEAEAGAVAAFMNILHGAKADQLKMVDVAQLVINVTKYGRTGT